MASDYLSSDFDPALYLHSELSNTLLRSEIEFTSFSDDIEALQQRRSEIAEENRRNGVVIQSRAWKLSDVFRSDDDSQPCASVADQSLSLDCIDNASNSDEIIEPAQFKPRNHYR